MNSQLKFYFTSLFLKINVDEIKESILTTSIHENHLFVVFKVNSELHSVDVKKDLRFTDLYNYTLFKKTMNNDLTTHSSCSFDELKDIFSKFLML